MTRHDLDATADVPVFIYGKSRRSLFIYLRMHSNSTGSGSSSAPAFVLFPDSVRLPLIMGLRGGGGPAVLRMAVMSHVVTFFLAMIVHELALEAASKAFPGLDALASAVTLFQFGFCFITPVLVTRGQALQTFPRTVNGCLPYIKLSGASFV